MEMMETFLFLFSSIFIHVNSQELFEHSHCSKERDSYRNINCLKQRLQYLEDENKLLREKNLKLEQQIVEKDDEIAKLETKINEGNIQHTTEGTTSKYITEDCSNGEQIGELDLLSKSQRTESRSGIAVLLNGPKYTFSCCGIISGFEFYTRDYTGTAYLQVWRETEASFTLVGQKEITVEDTGGHIESVSMGSFDRFVVQEKDVLGLYFPSYSFITYGIGGSYKQTSRYITGSSTFPWSSVPDGTDSRQYAVNAYSDANKGPTMNLDADVSYPASITPGFVVFTLYVSDPDLFDTVNVTETFNSSPTTFRFSNNTYEIKVASNPIPGTYTIRFSASDICKSTTTGTLRITITDF